MPREEDELESTLAMLGRQELALEGRMRALRDRARDSGRKGRFDEADMAWGLFEKTRESLRVLQSDITKAERKLYGARRSRRRR